MMTAGYHLTSGMGVLTSVWVKSYKSYRQSRAHREGVGEWLCPLHSLSTDAAEGDESRDDWMKKSRGQWCMSSSY